MTSTLEIKESPTKSRAQIINEARLEINKAAAKALAEPFQAFSRMFESRNSSHAMTPDGDVLSVTKGGIKIISHNEADSVMSRRIFGLLNKDYPERVEKALSKVSEEAENRLWEPELLERAIRAIRTDLATFNAQISQYLLDSSIELKHGINEVHVYDRIIGTTAGLENSIRQIVNDDLEDHLFGIARKVQIASLSRS
jgi:hypothetical protein